MRLGLASSVFVNYSVRDAIVQAAELGYDGIDIWGGRPHVYGEDLTRQELIALKHLTRELGLSVPSLMPAFFRYPYSLSNPNPIVRRDSIRYSCQCVENAEILEARTVLVIPGRTLHGQSHADGWNRMLESIAEIAKCAEQHGINLGIEPGNRMVTDLVNTSRDALEIIKTLGSKNIGVVLDTGHLNLTQEPLEEAIAGLGSALLQIHLNDNDGQRQQNLVPGDGSFDFALLVQLLGETGFTGFLSVELAWDFASDPIPALRESAERMQRYLSSRVPRRKRRNYAER